MARGNSSGQSGVPNSARTLYCIFCSKSHLLDNCKEFLKKSVPEREKFVSNKQLCFGCLIPGHSVSRCRSKMTCRICNRRHPTCLHHGQQKPHESPKEESPKDAQTSNEKKEAPAAAATVPEPVVRAHTLRSTKIAESRNAFSRLICPAIPVKVSMPGSQRKVVTYMGLDSFATDCFIDLELMQKLHTKGEDKNIHVTTMEAINSVMHTKLVKNLQVASLDEKTTYCIKQLYGKDPWPFEIDDSPRNEDIKDCIHLKDVPINFVKERKIGILIGMNQPDLLYPLEAVRGPPGKPFATQHMMGWALNGLVAGRSCEKGMHVHHIRIKDPDELKLRIDELYAQDFIDSQPGEKSPSIEDQEWKKLISSSYKINESGHSKIKLPFKETIENLPNNYCQVYSRIISAKKKFSQNSVLKNDYVAFMNEMISKGYMQKVSKEDLYGPAGKTWYLTHHSVYHKQKKKIRVVFDCSLKFQGKSQNDRLLQGPDLANNLVGVLIRFREYPIALSGDIEKMFLQV